MVQTIWKINLKVADEQTVSMPKNAQILTVGAQKDRAVMWILLNADDDPKENVERTIRIHGTGHFIKTNEEKEDLVYIGTFQVLNEGFVGHVFEVINRTP